MVRAIRSKTGLSFNGNNPIIPMQGGGAAAGLSTLSENLASIRRNAPDYTGMSVNAIQADGLVKRAISDAETATGAARVNAEATIEASKITADAQKDAARAKAQGSMVGSIAQAGIGLIGSAFLSDERTKNTIERIDDALSTLRQLKPVTYYYNEEYSSSPERLHHGFIAQDYAKVLPAATYYDDSLDRLCIDTGELIALLVRSVQQLETRVTRMEAKSALVEV